MPWYFTAIIIITLISISSKIDELTKKIDNLPDEICDLLEDQKINKNIKNLSFKEYLGKKVCLEIDNDEIENSYLFSSITDTIGEIIEFDSKWLLFRYVNKSKTVDQYFRISDIKSVYEIENVPQKSKKR